MRILKNIVFALLTVGIGILLILHPRVNYALMLCFCIFELIYSNVKKSEALECNREVTGKVKNEIVIQYIGYLLTLIVLWYAGRFVNLVVPYHAPYEYKDEIASLRMDDVRNYSQFPRSIPDGATKIKWINIPIDLKASGYSALFFYEEEAYIQEVYETYASYLPAYVYDAKYHSFLYDNTSAVFPVEKMIPEEEKEDVMVFIIEDNEDVHHQHVNGVYINLEARYVCYFTQ